MGTDEVIFLLVVGARLGIPLLIFRFPLPAILAALVLDAADQTIFQNNTNLDLTNYQSYDKALDVYYLAIAYLSTLRNWGDPFAGKVAAFLWYYRLVGVVLFELTQVRALLIIFPNTFEYFFIAYEVVRLAWNPARIGHRKVIGMAAFIWIFIKLPQEWWLHIAKLDVTDFMKEDVFGVTVETSWGDAISENLWFVGVVAILAGLIYFGARKALAAAPPRDWKVSVDVDSHVGPPPVGYVAPAKLLSVDLFEKIFLIGLVTVIFSQIVPAIDSSPLQLIFAVGLVVLANAAITQWLAARDHSWTTVLGEFGVMLLVNAGIVMLYNLVLRDADEPNTVGVTLFFVLLLTLIVTLFDRYRNVRSARALTAGSFEPAVAN